MAYWENFREIGDFLFLYQNVTFMGTTSKLCRRGLPAYLTGRGKIQLGLNIHIYKMDYLCTYLLTKKMRVFPEVTHEVGPFRAGSLSVLSTTAAVLLLEVQLFRQGISPKSPLQTTWPYLLDVDLDVYSVLFYQAVICYVLLVCTFVQVLWDWKMLLKWDYLQTCHNI